MKILVIGSGGMLGHVTTLYLLEKGYDVADISNNRKLREETMLLDVLDRDKITKYFEDNPVDIIINCAALLVKASIENKSKAIMLNSCFPHFLEEYFAGTGTKIVQVSTAGVFEGDKAPYNENDSCDTQVFYAKTKILGEIEGESNLVIRSDFIGPDMSENGTGLFNWIMNSSGEVSGYSNVLFNGVSSLEFAKFIEKVINNNYTGIYHLYSKDVISKADYVRLVSNEMGKSLAVTDNETVKRNTSLISTREDITYTNKSFLEQMRELRQWIFDHKDLYAHYFDEGSK